MERTLVPVVRPHQAPLIAASGRRPAARDARRTRTRGACATTSNRGPRSHALPPRSGESQPGPASAARLFEILSFLGFAIGRLPRTRQDQIRFGMSTVPLGSRCSTSARSSLAGEGAKRGKDFNTRGARKFLPFYDSSIRSEEPRGAGQVTAGYRRRTFARIARGRRRKKVFARGEIWRSDRDRFWRSAPCIRSYRQLSAKAAALGGERPIPLR